MSLQLAGYALCSSVVWVENVKLLQRDIANCCQKTVSMLASFS